LRLVSGTLQLAVAPGQRRVQLIGALHRRAQHRRAQAVNVASRGIQNQKALRGEYLRIELRESLRKGLSRLPGGAQRL
jgi:hypothetical protein